MIDLHCHILPGVDDGALDLPDSLAMARVAAADGIETICATPHIRQDHDVRIAELPERVGRLNAALREADVAVEVVAGGEVAETAVRGLDQDELEAVSLGAGGWILLEPAPGPLGPSLAESVEELRWRGFGAVIAHPERHIAADMIERLRELTARGALVQVTAAHLTQREPRRGMTELARHGLVHLLGSDAHSSHGGRPLQLSAGRDALAEIEAVAPHLDWIVRDAPAAILRGDRPEPPF